MFATTERIKQIVVEGHAGQVRMDGGPYANHPLRVAERLRIQGYSEATQQLGLVHDLVEDTPWTFNALLGESIDPEVVEDLQYLTKSKDPAFYRGLFHLLDDTMLDEYAALRESGYVSHEHALSLIRAAHRSPRVRAVKLADSTDNLNDTLGLIEIALPNVKHVRQLGKYATSVAYLSQFPVVLM